MLVGRGRSSAAQWPVSPSFLVGQVAAPVSSGRLHVPPCSMAWLCGSEEPTSSREVLDSLGILSLVLPLVGQDEGVLVGRGRSSVARWLVCPCVLVGQTAGPVSDVCPRVPPYIMPWLLCMLPVGLGVLGSAGVRV